MKTVQKWLGLGVAAVALTATSGFASTFYWTNTTASIWNDGFSWSPLGIPAASDTGAFYSNGTYHVTFTNNTTAALAFGGDANVTFDLAGTMFTRPLIAPVFDVSANAKWLLTNGVMNNSQTQYVGRSGNYATQIARVTVGQGGVWNQIGAQFVIGSGYAGEFIVENGGQLNTDENVVSGILIGTDLGTGLLKVDGAGSAWTNANNLSTLNQLYLANTAGSTGTVTVSNGGVAVHKGGNVNIGYNGVAAFNILSGGTFDATPMQGSTTFYIGQGSTGVGTGMVSGANSKLWVGANGQTHSFMMGNVAGSRGYLTIEDGGSLVFKGKTFFVGATGSGYLTVQNGGLLDLSQIDTNSTIYIGNANGSTGVVTVTGSTSQFKSAGDSNLVTQLIVGNQAGSRGTLNISSNATLTHKGSDVFIGSSGYGFLNLTDGGVMDLRGSIRAKALYIGNGSGGSGTVYIAGTGSALWAGSNATTIASNGGSLGSMLIEQGGAFYSSNTVNVGVGGAGTLTIRNGGSLRISNRPGFSIGYSANAPGSIGKGTFLLTDSNSWINVGDFSVGASRGTGVVTIANGATGTFYRTVCLGGSAVGYTANGTLTVTGTNSVLSSVLGQSDQTSGATYICVGASTYSPTNWDTQVFSTMDGSQRGKGVLVAENGGLIRTAQRMYVLSNSAIRVDGGHIQVKEAGLESNSVFQAVLRLGDANSSQSLLTVTNEVRLFGATLDVQLGSDFVYQYGDTYRLLSFGTMGVGVYGYGFVDTLGNTLVDDDNIVVGGVTFDYAFDSLDPNHITLTAIPEPGSLGLIGAGIGLAALLRRRRG